jgi:hypothetical protein
MSGDKCEPPKTLAQDAQQQMWIAGWHEGQTILIGRVQEEAARRSAWRDQGSLQPNNGWSADVL